MPEELSPSQAASRIGATTRSVQRWIAAGQLPARRVGGRWRVASDALDAFSTPSERASPVATRAIRNVFIANRGEIAARIARTCERLGIRVITPATDGPDTLDLLDDHAVVSAARLAGANALHPGVGFLAESAVFAEAVVGAGIGWVGPPAAAIRALGDKAEARRLARRLGIPVLPGYDDADQADETLLGAARRLSVPLVVKPAGGGGGKGMRIVRDLAELPDALSGARREAAAAFGDERLVLERFLDGPRHVEIQILFDTRGVGVHLGERDCSIQRRHQKILEETPSPAVDGATRARLCDAALALARAAGYASAGTVEFLLEDGGGFFFLEMNARLQVEHPVTEIVTGRDLVADQLRIAAGGPLEFGQADVHLLGHAVEARLYAEDAEAGFLPATGRVELLRWPAGEGIRVDAGVAAGDEVGGRFDPLLAKIVAHGRDRAEALGRLRDALDRTIVLGLTTNLRFLRWLVRQPAVVEGEARIDTLARIWPPSELAEQTRIPDDAWRTAARALLGEPPGEPGTRSTDSWAGAWRLNAPTTARLATDTEERQITLESGPPSGRPHASVTAGDTVHVDIDSRSVPFRLAPPPDVDRAARSAAAQHGALAQVIAPMPGAVIAVHVAAGADQAVEAGDPIVTLEAMKMEHVVTAPVRGSVRELRVRPGDQVARGQLLAVVEP